MEFWRLVQRPKRHQNLVVKLMRDLESGYFAVPNNYDVLTSYRTEPLPPARFAKTDKVQLREQPLVKKFFETYPEARSEPVSLGSFQPPLSRRFTQRQAEIVRTPHLPPGGSFAATARELEVPLAEMRRRAAGEVAGGSGALEFTQQREQEQLDAGMAALAEGAPLPETTERPGGSR